LISKTVEIFDIGEIDTDFGDYFQPTAAVGGPVLTIDNQLVIAIGFPPEYPNRALMRGIEGYAIVGFSVSAVGSVVAPYIVESEPNTVFDRSSLKAISKFKYKARMVNGRAVSTDGQRYMFTFKLDN
jgi:protein TonB